MKNKKWLWLLPGLLVLAMVLFLCLPRAPERQETSAPTETSEPTEASAAAADTPEPLPDSMLCYGTILEVTADEAGTPTRLRMDSPRDGLYVFLLGEDTCYVDSGERTSFDPRELKAEDRVYVACSPISLRSMPPQSQAFVVLNNIPMDASCAMYHEAEEIREEGDRTLITTDNGSLTLELSSDAQVLSYEEGTGALSDLQVGDFFLAWYWNRGEELLPASHIMLLP